MNPHQKNKIDINSLSADEQRLFRMYGKLPNKKELLQNKLKERKYFDSGDYAMSKAGKASDTGDTSIGTEHPKAEEIPHASPLHNTLTRGDSISAGPGQNPLQFSPDGGPMLPGAGIHRGSINGIPGGGLPGASSRSPVKESSFLARTASIDREIEEQNEGQDQTQGPGSNGANRMMSPPAHSEGIPIRR